MGRALYECREASTRATELVQHQRACHWDKRWHAPSTGRPSASAWAARCTRVSRPPSAPTVAAYPQGQTLQVRPFTKCSSCLATGGLPRVTGPTREGYVGRHPTGGGTWSTTATRTLASGPSGATGGARPWRRALWGRGWRAPEDAQRAEGVPAPPVERHFPKSAALTLQERTHSNERPC